MNFAKFHRMSFLQNTPGRMLENKPDAGKNWIKPCELCHAKREMYPRLSKTSKMECFEIIAGYCCKALHLQYLQESWIRLWQ